MPDKKTIEVELTGEIARLRERVAALESDLEAERRTAAELRDSERKYRLLADNSRDVIWTLDTNLCFTYVSPSLRHLLGIDPAEFLNRPVTATLLPESLAAVMDIVNQRLPRLSPLDKDKPVTLEIRYQHRDGTLLWVEIVAQFVFDDAGNWSGVVGVSRDVTARHVAEQALRDSESRYRLLAETAGDIILVHDFQGRISYINHAGIEFSGYSETDLAHLTLQELLPPDECARMNARADQRAAGDTSRYVYEVSFVNKAGDLVPLEVASQPLPAAGRPAQMLVVARDISQRRQLEAQLRQAQKMEILGQLSGGVAHDFNNLLTTIAGYSEFVRQALAPDDPASEDIHQVIRAAERASRLTKQLLAFSRRQVMNPTLLRLDNLLLEMAKMLRRLIGTDVELVILPGDAGPVKADLTQLEQVIINLAVNACDAMPHGGKLFFATRDVSAPPGMPDGPYVLLAVRDTGTGMSPEIMQRIFEPFYTTKDTGTGLGLSTVYGIVKQHGGEIVVRSEPTAGTTFEIYLPRLTAGETEELHAIESGLRVPTGSETILLAEDEPAVRTTTVRMLESLGYHVLAATNGDEALRLASEYGAAIDLLLTDLVMPQMGGGDLAARITKVLPDCRVLFISGYADDTTIREIALDGKLHFLEKPYSRRTLAHKVRQVLDAR